MKYRMALTGRIVGLALLLKIYNCAGTCRLVKMTQFYSYFHNFYLFLFLLSGYTISQGTVSFLYIIFGYISLQNKYFHRCTPRLADNVLAASLAGGGADNSNHKGRTF
jgi:hypothetical protein